MDRLKLTLTLLALSLGGCAIKHDHDVMRVMVDQHEAIKDCARKADRLANATSALAAKVGGPEAAKIKATINSILATEGFPQYAVPIATPKPTPTPSKPAEKKGSKK